MDDEEEVVNGHERFSDEFLTWGVHELTWCDFLIKNDCRFSLFTHSSDFFAPFFLRLCDFQWFYLYLWTAEALNKSFSSRYRARSIFGHCLVTRCLVAIWHGYLVCKIANQRRLRKRQSCWFSNSLIQLTVFFLYLFTVCMFFVLVSPSRGQWKWEMIVLCNFQWP